MNQQNLSSLPDEVILSRIYFIRGYKVMLDRDLAEMYGVETKYLKRQVRRNMLRFPEDFMFELSKEELENWRRQFVTSNGDKMGLRYLPMAFTEDGVAQLSTVLNSKQAIMVNIQIIRLFGKMRKMLLTHKDILIKIERIENQLAQNSEDVKLVFRTLRELLQPVTEPRRKIGFIRDGQEG